MLRTRWSNNTAETEFYPYIIRQSDLMLIEGLTSCPDTMMLIFYSEEYAREWKKDPFRMVIDDKTIIKKIQAPLIDVEIDVSDLSNDEIEEKINSVLDELILKLTTSIRRNRFFIPKKKNDE